MFLNDERYEDEHGRFIDRTEIECLGTYEFKSDGFFRWCCGNCNHTEGSRAYKIGGTVWKCRECGKRNLLVRTDIKFINQKMAVADRNDTDAEMRIKRALTHIGKGIAELGK